MKKTLIAGLLGATLLGGVAVAATQNTPAPAPMTKADANQDGVVTRAEARAHADARFNQADANHDGRLTADERTAMHGKHGRKGPGMAGGGGMRGRMLERFDADKDGKLSDAERQAARAAMHARMLERFDADKDGKLSPAEHQAARDAMKGMRGSGHGPGHGDMHPPADAPTPPTGN